MGSKKEGLLGMVLATSFFFSFSSEDSGKQIYQDTNSGILESKFTRTLKGKTENM